MSFETMRAGAAGAAAEGAGNCWRRYPPSSEHWLIDDMVVPPRFTEGQATVAIEGWSEQSRKKGDKQLWTKAQEWGEGEAKSRHGGY
jgi:hypothetical protein